jgi:glycosyltransferase involved in cell wall biosynthesis
VSAATTLDNRGYEQEVRALTTRLGLDDAVHFLGEREDVERILSALDVVLVPSTEEPFGRTVIESLAMQVPVVATAAGGPANVIRHGVDGEVADVNDLDAWVDAVNRQIARGGSAESRRYAVERFSRERHAAAIKAVHERALSRAATG